MTAKELLSRMPEALDREAAAGTDAVIQYETSEPIYQVLANGELTVHEGRAEKADLTIRMSDQDLVQLFRGELNPMMAFMTGRIKVSGDLQLAQRLVGFVDQERLRDARA